MYKYKITSKSSNSQFSSESTESLNPNQKPNPYVTVTAPQVSHEKKKKNPSRNNNTNNNKPISDEDLLQHTGMTLAQIRERARDRAGVAGNQELGLNQTGTGTGKGTGMRLESFAVGFTRGLGGYA